MSKAKEILKEASTWTLGVPSILLGVLTLLKDDNAQVVTDIVQSAGESYAASGDWQQAAGWLVAGLVSVFMKGR